MKSNIPNLYNSKILNNFINSHGWIDYNSFNKWINEQGYDIIILERHNQTDGEVHFRYIDQLTKKSIDFNGNYWDGKSFYKIIEWIISIR